MLGLLLFLIYVNDFADSLLSLTRLFADDSSLFHSVSSLDDIEGIKSHDLIILSQWAKQWLVTFNPSKTEAILFTLRNFDHMSLLKFEDTHIKFVESLTLSYDGKWTDHMHNVKTSAAKVLRIMRKLNLSFSLNALNQIYIFLIYCQSWSMPLLFGTVVQPIILIFLIKFKLRLPAS